jgi:hypothetical protein
MVGIALRFALAAGLHLRNDDPSTMATKKETLVRTWWSLHSIESLLCAIVGRPCIIPNDECTVPLPHIGPEKMSTESNTSHSSAQSAARGDSDTVTRSSFSGARVTMAIIMQKALAKLYAPQLAADAWDRVQSDITALLRETDEWAVSAHLVGLSPANSIEESGLERAKLVLSFHYHSAKLLICRPCLCRIERRNKGQSGASADFYQRTADICVQSAQAISNLLPDQFDPQFVYEQCPWWSIVHHIMQAVAVLLLKMSLGGSHNVHDGEDLSAIVVKLARWLHCMSSSNNVADRACRVVLDIIRASAPRIRIDVSVITSQNNDALRTEAGTASSRPSLATRTDSSDSRPSLSTPADSASSRPSLSTRGDSVSSRPSLSARSVPGFSNPGHSSGTSQQPRQPQAPQSYLANLSPHSLAPTISWSPQDAYTTPPTAISPDIQTLRRQEYSGFAGAASYTGQSQFGNSLQMEQMRYPSKQDLSPQNQPLQTVQQGLEAPFSASQDYGNYAFNPDFSLDASMQMPSLFGNPFLTNFDQANMLAGMSGGGSSDGSVSEGMGIGMVMGGEFAQGTGEESRR